MVAPARIGGVGLQRVCDWVLRFSAHGSPLGPDESIDAEYPGAGSNLSV